MKYTSFFLLFLFFWAGCSSDNNSQFSGEVVARVGNNNISRQDFEISYWLEPQYAIRTSLANAYKSQVEYLIDQEYFYLAADMSGLAEEADLVQKIDYIKEKEIFKTYIRENFLDTVHVTDEELREGLRRLSKSRYSLNIFSKDIKEIENLQSQINGTNVDPAVFFTTQGQDLGWITFGNVDGAVEDAIYANAPGTVSGIVQSSYGYHLVLVTEEQDNPVFKNMIDRVRLENVLEIIRKRKADEAIREKLNLLAEGQKLGINNRVMNKIAGQFLLLQNSAEQNPMVIVPPLNNRELSQVEAGIADLRHEPLVRLGDLEMTVDQFIERLRIMPPFHRPYLKGYNRFNQAVIEMIRTDLLTRDAIDNGYENNTNVQQQIQKHRKELLGREFRRRYFSEDFKNNNSVKWQKYDDVLREVKSSEISEIFEKNLYNNIYNPDSPHH